ncbi:hypothetical protein [Aeromonas caviae]|uniref:hypothetical protein n=1 Tax=Aeromonas caviae TaxID=648 RepID=UPI003F78B20F
MTTPTITELYAQIGAMMANWQRFLDQQMGWQAGPSSANDLSPPDNNPANKGYRVMIDATGNKRQIMTPSQMEKIVADAVKKIDDLKPSELSAQLMGVRADVKEITATLSSSRAELTALSDNATSSKNSAASSATAASSSKTAAASSATAAASSATAAASSATAASSSKTAAAESQGVATAKAAESKASATEAANKASDATLSASTASTKAAEAVASATTASTKADEASSSATSAASSATEASGHASNASNSASAAAAKASEAATGASTATAKANAAASSATAASGSATAASNSATAAANSASSAANSATAASSSKTAAASSAEEAAASAKAAREAMYVSTGALIEAGDIDMSSGTYPAPLKDASGKNLACFWKVTKAGIAKVDGVDYEIGDTLVYSSASSKFYKIDNTESVLSVNGMKGPVVLTAAHVGALGATATAVAAAKLATARLISITGDGEGSASFDGTGNVSINLTVADDSHAHTFANLKNRPTTLSGYGITDAAAAGHAHDDLFQNSGGVITGLTQVNIASGPTIGGTTFDNGWLRVGTSAGGIAIDPNEIAVSGNDLSFGTITNNIVSLVVNNTRIGEMRSDGLYSMGSKVLTALEGSAVSAGKLSTARALSLTGDATGSMNFDGSANASMAVTLANSGVTAGTFTKVTVDAKGRVTSGSAMVAADIPNLDWSKITSGKPTTLAGYGITDAQAKHANLTALAGVSPAADRIPYFTSGAAASVTALTAFARSLLDDNDAAAARATLGVLSIEEPFKSAADVATTANLDATYANGSSGEGATLTSKAMATLSLDGVTVTVGMRVLVKNQNAPAENGIYTMTTAGSTTVAWVLTRATDADTSAKLAGAVVTVDQGAANGSLLLTNDWKKTSVVGTTAMNWRVVLDSGNVGAYHHNSGATAGTYRSVTVNAQGHVTAGSNPTTLSGYGITDAAPSSHVGSGGGAHSVATASVNGFMSGADKAKLDSIASNANNYSHPAEMGTFMSLPPVRATTASS